MSEQLGQKGQNFTELSARLTELLQREKPLPGHLYIVGTPLGNRADISPRALGILAQVDLIAAEDTRHSGELLSYYGINGRYLSFHEHNAQERKQQLASELQAGQAVALISDAGMPSISDPGQVLVDYCLELGIPVKVVPGPSAGIAALALSGLPSENFQFIGFLPVKGKPRREAIARLAAYPGTTILYEAPHRLVKTLKELVGGGFGQRRLASCRELTKQYEEVQRGTVTELLARYEAEAPRGEFVLVLEGPSPEEREEQSLGDLADLQEQIREGIAQGLSDRDIMDRSADQAGSSPGLSRNDLKRLIRELREEAGQHGR